MSLEETVSELQLEVKVLHKLVGIMMDSIAEAKLANKTADKALEMAQEALVVVTAGARQNFEDPMTEDKWSHEKVVGPSIKISAPNRAISDEALSEAMNEQDNVLGNDNEPN